MLRRVAGRANAVPAAMGDMAKKKMVATCLACFLRMSLFHFLGLSEIQGPHCPMSPGRGNGLGSHLFGPTQGPGPT